MITDADIKKLSKIFATKDELNKFATKDDLFDLELRVNRKIETLESNMATKSDMQRVYDLLDKILGNQEDFRMDFLILNDQVQRHEKILQGMA